MRNTFNVRVDSAEDTEQRFASSLYVPLDFAFFQTREEARQHRANDLVSRRVILQRAADSFRRRVTTHCRRSATRQVPRQEPTFNIFFRRTNPTLGLRRCDAT